MGVGTAFEVAAASKPATVGTEVDADFAFNCKHDQFDDKRPNGSHGGTITYNSTVQTCVRTASSVIVINFARSFRSA